MLICGIDEAGRGTLAGSLFMAGVILKREISGLDDSKKLTSKKREALFSKIIENSNYHIFSIGAEEIDNIGLSRALQIGLLEIVSNLKAERYIFDGNSNFGVSGVETLIKGDSLVQEISASSILAKVMKDREMVRFSADFPQWDFEKHKGYGTKAHIDKIREFGYSPIHRKSFKIKSLESSLF
jgi:ribonuclease HII